MDLKLKAYVSDKWRGKGNVVTNHWFTLKTEQENNTSLITLPNSQFIKPTDSSSSPGCLSRLHGKDLFKVLLSFTATDPLLYCYYGGYYHLRAPLWPDFWLTTSHAQPLLILTPTWHGRKLRLTEAKKLAQSLSQPFSGTAKMQPPHSPPSEDKTLHHVGIC